MYTNHMIFSWKNPKILVFFRFLYCFFSFFSFFVFGDLWPESYPGHLPGIARVLVYPGTSLGHPGNRGESTYGSMPPPSTPWWPLFRIQMAASTRVLVAPRGAVVWTRSTIIVVSTAVAWTRPLVPWCPRDVPGSHQQPGDAEKASGRALRPQISKYKKLKKTKKTVQKTKKN